MSDVVLVYPKTGLDVKKVSIGLPLPLLAAASEVVQDFSVKIIDQRVDDNWQQTLISEMASKPLCVGITAMTGHQIFHGLNAARIAKEHSENTPVVWGGMHVTLSPEQSMKHPLVDIVVKGDGEWVFRDLVRALAAKTPVSDVKGIFYKEKGETRFTGEAPMVVLDQTFPYPFQLVDVEHYVTPGEYLFPGVKRVLPFMGSRGCPFKCTFCSEPALTRIYRMMKPELIYERTSDMARKYKLDMILFYDEEFFVNKRWATRIAELINGEFKWWTQTRANDLLKVDLKKIEKGGMHVTVPGLESGSNRVLKFIKKEETVEEYRVANRRLAETNILVMYNFMMGFPTETNEELYETIDFAMEVMRDNPRAYVHSLSLFTPLPGTELLEQSKGYGHKPPEDMESWTETTRHNFVTPWVKDNLNMYLNLAYTSKFVGPRAKMMAQGYWFIPGFIFDLYDRIIQSRWRRRFFKNTWDVKFLSFLHKKIVNPVLTRPQNQSAAPANGGNGKNPDSSRSSQSALEEIAAESASC